MDVIEAMSKVVSSGDSGTFGNERFEGRVVGEIGKEGSLFGG